jgi:hypothetical protein
MRDSLPFTIIFFVFLTSVFEAFAQQEVSVYPQPDSPLQISKISAKWGVEEVGEGRKIPSLLVNYSLQNVSSKAIRAYAISVIEGDFGKPEDAFPDLAIPTGCRQFLSPTQSRIATFHNISTIAPQGSVKMAVDFVEFTDGSTWGKGASYYAPLLTAFRNGVMAAYEYLQTVERNNGVDAVIKTLDELPSLTAPKEADKFYFRTGAKAVGRRIKARYEKEGLKAITDELANNSLYNCKK